MFSIFKKIVRVCVFSTMFCLISAGPSAAETAGSDVLDLIPADAAVCMKINDLDGTLYNADQFFMGISPLSFNMFLKMQIAQLLGSPQLTGVDMKGTFAVAMFPAEGAAQKITTFQPGPYLIFVPLADAGSFSETLSQAPRQEGVYNLPATTPMGGASLFIPPGKSYAVVTPEAHQAALISYKKDVSRQTTPADWGLRSALSAQHLQDAASPGLWAYANIGGMYDRYAMQLENMVNMARQMIMFSSAANPDQAANAKMLMVYLELVSKSLAELDSLSINLEPGTEVLHLKKTLTARAGTDMAEMLVPDPDNTPGFKLAGFLDKPAVVNCAMKTNRVFAEKFNRMFLDALSRIFPTQAGSEQLTKLNELMAGWLDVVGDEMAFSFSYMPGTPPIEIVEVIRVQDTEKSRALLRKAIPAANDIYRLFNLPMSLELQPAAMQLAGTEVDMVKFDMKQPVAVDANDPQAQGMKLAADMYKNAAYNLAFVNDMMLFYMGPDYEDKMAGLIDKTKRFIPVRPSGDMKTVIQTLPGAAGADFVASFNILRAMTGGLYFMPHIKQANPHAAEMLEKIAQSPPQSQSCLAAAGTVGDGSITTEIALPRQHLLEIVEYVNTMKPASGPEGNAGKTGNKDSDMPRPSPAPTPAPAD